MSAERWYSKRELARELHVSVSSIERHVRPTLRVGGMNRYEMSDVRRQLSGESPGTGKRCDPVLGSPPPGRTGSRLVAGAPVASAGSVAGSAP